MMIYDQNHNCLEVKHPEHDGDKTGIFVGSGREGYYCWLTEDQKKQLIIELQK
jgi:hypothetical protein